MIPVIALEDREEEPLPLSLSIPPPLVIVGEGVNAVKFEVGDVRSIY